MKQSEPNSRRFALRGRALDVSSPLVMGILNVTPDSFSDGSRYSDTETALQRIEEMIRQGADIIDIGGESTRPGSDPVPEQEEINRVIPVLERAVQRFQETFFSLDTTKYEVASRGLQAGVHIINDVSGLQKEPAIADLCASYEAGLIIMHSKGDPKTMQDDPRYDDVVQEVFRFLKKQAELAERKGVNAIWVDPGIGFGKTLEHNLKLLAAVDKFSEVGYPVLVGASRKSMFAKLLGERSPDQRVTPTLAAHYHTLIKGASVIRVHDVLEAKDSVEVYKAIYAME